MRDLGSVAEVLLGRAGAEMFGLQAGETSVVAPTRRRSDVCQQLRSAPSTASRKAYKAPSQLIEPAGGLSGLPALAVLPDGSHRVKQTDNELR